MKPPDAELSELRKSSPSRARIHIFAGLLAAFTFWTYLAVSSGSPHDVQDRRVWLTTLATITGPFVGPIARHGQPCCMDFALELAWRAAPVLVVCLIAQLVPFPFRRGRQAFRLTLWTLGWFVWFFSGTVSFTHALF